MRSRVFYMVPALWCLATPSLAAGTQVAAAANRAAFAAERLYPGGDDTGFTPAVAVSLPGINLSRSAGATLRD